MRRRRSIKLIFVGLSMTKWQICSETKNVLIWRIFRAGGSNYFFINIMIQPEMYLLRLEPLLVNLIRVMAPHAMSCLAVPSSIKIFLLLLLHKLIESINFYEAAKFWTQKSSFNISSQDLAVFSMISKILQKNVLFNNHIWIHKTTLMSNARFRCFSKWYLLNELCEN